jgi:hypothetical protein
MNSNNNYNNENRGAVWPNKNKKTDKHPTHTGSMNSVCPHCQTSTEFWVNGWVGDKTQNKPSFSFSVNAKETPAPATQKKSEPVDLSDVPF